MGNLSWKRGRFDVTYETTDEQDALRGRIDEVGDYFDYYRFDAADSTMDPVYDEAVGQGKVYKGPFRWPAWHVTHLNGVNENGQQGFYFNDSLNVVASVSELASLGLTDLDVNNGEYYQDRIVYPPDKKQSKVYRVTNMSIVGQVQERHLVIGIECTQLKADELGDDSQFLRWSVQGNGN